MFPIFLFYGVCFAPIVRNGEKITDTVLKEDNIAGEDLQRGDTRGMQKTK